MQDNPALFDALMRDQDRASGIFHPGPCWAEYAARVAWFIRRDGIRNFRNHEGVGKGYADTFAGDPFESVKAGSPALALRRAMALIPFAESKVFGRYREMIEKYRDRAIRMEGELNRPAWRATVEANRALLARIDTVAGGARRVLDIDGAAVSFLYLDFLRRTDFAAAGIGMEERTALIEIGGGFGAQTHIMLERFPSIRTALYVDLAPMVYVGTEYLRRHFGNRVMDYIAVRQALESGVTDFTGRIVCVPPFMLDRLQVRWDVGWNACSFQEMTAAQIGAYMGWLDANAGPGAEMAAVFYPDESGRTLSAARFLESLPSPGMRDAPVSTGPDGMTYACLRFGGRANGQAAA